MGIHPERQGHLTPASENYDVTTSGVRTGATSNSGRTRLFKKTEVRAHSFVNLRGVALPPPEDGDVIHGQAALTHHLFEAAVRELASAIPPDA